MNCYTFKDKISEYLESQLSINQINSYKNHKKKCNDCSNTHYGVKNIIESTKNLDKLFLSSDFNSRLFLKLRNKNNNINKNILNKNFFGYKPQYLIGSFFAFFIIFMIIFNLTENQGSNIPEFQSSTQNNNLDNNDSNLLLTNDAIEDSTSDSIDKKNIIDNFLNSKAKTVDYIP